MFTDSTATAETQGELHTELTCREITEKTTPETLIFTENQTYRGFCMHSAGNIEVTVKNRSSHKAMLKVSFIKTHYPVYMEADTIFLPHILGYVTTIRVEALLIKLCPEKLQETVSRILCIICWRQFIAWVLEKSIHYRSVIVGKILYLNALKAWWKDLLSLNLRTDLTIVMLGEGHPCILYRRH